MERTRRTNTPTGKSFSADLHFMSCFVQQMFHVLLVTYKAKDLRELLRDCICRRSEIERDSRRRFAFRILLCPTNASCAAGDLRYQGLDRAAQRLHLQTIRDRTRLTSYQTVSSVALCISTQLGGTHVTVSLGWCLSNDFLLLVKHRPAPLSARGG